MYIWNRKKRCKEIAKCRHCQYFHFSHEHAYLGTCSNGVIRGLFSNSLIACDKCFIWSWIPLPPDDMVQLNLFENEKSV